MKPIDKEHKARRRKSPAMMNGVAPLNSLSGPTYSLTALKRMIPTASLVIPSPKTKLNSLGYFSAFITAIPATTSELQRREHINKISNVVNENSVVAPVVGLYFSKLKICTAQ